MLLVGLYHPPHSIQSSQVIQRAHTVVQLVVLTVNLRLEKIYWSEFNPWLYIVWKEIANLPFFLPAEEQILRRECILPFEILFQIEAGKNWKKAGLFVDLVGVILEQKTGDGGLLVTKNTAFIGSGFQE